MPYTILRFKKDKGGAIAGCERHNERKKDAYKSNPDIDITRTKYNYHIIQAPKYTYGIKIKKLIKKYECKTRKDSIRLVETLITASPEFMSKLSEEEKREYFERATEFMESEIGEDRIISAVVHMDERTPHMHLAFCPINQDGKLSAKSILGNQKSLSEWQTRYYEFMHERWPELKRGQSAQVTKRKHIPTWLFKMADNLDYLYHKLSNVIENINLIGMKKDKAEAIELLSEFVPKAQKFSAKVNSYKDYIRELEIKVINQKYNNKDLVEENNELKKQIEDKELETSMKLMNMQSQIKKYENYIKKIPKDVLDESPNYIYELIEKVKLKAIKLKGRKYSIYRIFKYRISI